MRTRGAGNRADGKANTAASSSSSAKRAKLVAALNGHQQGEGEETVGDEHREKEQVQRDVERSLNSFFRGSEAQREAKRQELARVINAILATHPDLYYYQAPTPALSLSPDSHSSDGFHDVATVFLLLAGEDRAYAMLERVALNHLRYPFRRVCPMNATLESTTQLLSLLPHLISFAQPGLHAFLLQSGVEPYYAISWVLTWFAHDVDQWSTVTRLYDAFLAAHPMLCLYLAAALVARSYPDILHQECEYPAVHSYLSHLPERYLAQPQDVEELIGSAVDLMRRLPPSALLARAQGSIPPNSPFLAYPFPWMKNTTPQWRRLLIGRSRSAALVLGRLLAAEVGEALYKYTALLVLSLFTLLTLYVFHTSFS
ncbi:TBC domain containing protein [Acanthamoeba castellanii str. Neff]|uniref:TBC domain containing protein n=1 Tax=Acanthamoeba castellanii (strain ATCC 30010 / Neff) TaxID=1257118 RepID=L8GZY8_ACACF|nr:TBC domain containing protein [Acanthamoeba castellanii str. Neff]ELR17666.1 TBC domain containing protein [Acanthamoeba castellanii str. Neff]